MLSSSPRRIRRDSFVLRSKRPSAIRFSCGKRNAILLPSGETRGWRTLGSEKNFSIGSGVSAAKNVAEGSAAKASRHEKRRRGNMGENHAVRPRACKFRGGPGDNAE